MQKPLSQSEKIYRSQTELAAAIRQAELALMVGTLTKDIPETDSGIEDLVWRNIDGGYTAVMLRITLRLLRNVRRAVRDFQPVAEREERQLANASRQSQSRKPVSRKKGARR